MGHERLGMLPKTKKWRDIVSEIAATDGPSVSTSTLAEHTLQAIGSRYGELAQDKAVGTTFSFLVELARAAAAQHDPSHLVEKTPSRLVGRASPPPPRGHWLVGDPRACPPCGH